MKAKWIGGLIVIMLLSGGSVLGEDMYWQRDPETMGDWFDAINWANDVPGPSDRAFIDNGGTAEISSGTASVTQMSVGSYNDGHFRQTGGNVYPNETFSVAYYAGSTGSYDMTAGSMYSSEFRVGYGGVGTFSQTVGDIGSQNFYVGRNSTGDGAFVLDQTGRVSTGRLYVGFTGTGAFTQKNGIVTARTYAMLGHQGSLGTYAIEGGSFTTDRLYIGRNSSSANLFHQSGGTVTIDSSLVLATEYSHANGKYLLESGVLSTEYEDIGSRGTGVFEQTGGTNTVGYRVLLGGSSDSSGTFNLRGGVLSTVELEVGRDGTGVFSIDNSAANISVSGKLKFGYDSTFDAVPGATIHMTGSHFENESTDPAALSGLENVSFIFEGGLGQNDTFEIAGEDLGGDDPAGLADNFAIDTLQLGGSDVGVLQLVDLFDNQADGQTVGEALYVKNLIVGPGCSLDLNGLNLYYLDVNLDPAGEIIGGTPTKIIPEPATLSLLALGGVALLRRRKRRGRK